MSNEKRSSFTGSIGFVLAAAGSAVGLGNIWRFPYLAAEYGGGIFLLVYIILAVTFGFALMVAETAIGRKTGLSAIGAFKKLNKKYAFLGYIAALVPIIILPYYSQIGGWVMKYFYAFASGGGVAAAGETYFGDFRTGNEGKLIEGGLFANITAGIGEPVLWLFLFLAITAIVVLFGVEKGIEKVSKVMMPILIVLSIFIAVYSVSMPGAMKGVVFYIKPNFSKFSIKTVLAAMGQLFYSMSLAMGIMITYGSYMKKKDNIEKSVRNIEIFDTGIAFLAGLMIIPAIFALESNPDVAKGPGLMFVTLPKLFAQMPFGQVVGFSFFLLVLFAALTSSISLMETIVSIFCDKFKINRKLSCLIVFVLSLAIGTISCFGYSIWSNFTIIRMQLLDFFDFMSNSVIMPIVALFTCIFVGYVIKPKSIIEEVESSGKFKAKKLFVFVIKYAAPICIVLILISSALDGLANVFDSLKMFKI